MRIMKKIISTATKVAAVAFAMSTFSFAGPGLADGAAKFVGNITTHNQVRSDFTQLWNQITAENECKWASIEGTRGKFSWGGCDAAYNWAKNNGGHFKFHALVWGSQYPSWLNGLSADETKKAITNWMDAVKQHYPDLEMIDVVNEAIWAGDNYHSGYGKPAAGAEGHSTDDTECGGSYIIEALGGDRVVNGKHQYDFVKTAFVMARERWPKAVLIYNDYNTLSWQINEGIELIQTILKNGAPVDAYGQQAHDCKGMSKSDFESKMTRIHNETGLPLLVSEYDIGEADDTKQKNDYANQVPFMWETPWVAGITIWGYINGSTWVQNTGLIQQNGTKRASMNWLEDYFAKNLNKGQNEVTFTPVEPEPQLPFKGQPISLPGKVEAEDFDIPGVGVNEDGTSNQSYSDDSENHGDSDYRKDTGVDLYKKATGVIVGYNSEGDWLEWTVNVKEAGDYTMFAAVAAAGSTSSFQLSLDGKALTDVITVPAAKSGEENYDDYNKVSANVTLPEGTHVLRMDVTGAWFDVDYFTFVKGKDATDPEPIIGEDDPGTTSIADVKFDAGKLQDYYVFDQNGVRLGLMSAYGFNAAADMLRSSSMVKTSGVYYLRNRFTGAMQSVRVTR